MLFTIQLIIILICLFYGARKGGIALGLLGGIGLVILVFVFHLQPGKPPVDVMLVIIAVVAASATLQPLMVAILSSSTCWQSPFHRR